MNDTGRDINLEALVHVFLRHARALIMIAIFAPGAALSAWLALPDSFESTARLLVQEQKTVNPFLDDMAVEWTLKQRLPLIESVVESQATLATVLMRIDELDPRATPAEIERAVAAFERQVEVIGLGAGLVKVKVKGKSPDFVYRATNALVDSFIAEMLRPQKQAVQSSAKFLEGQINRLREEIQGLEGEVTKYKTDHAAELPELHRLNLDAHLALQKSLLEAEARLAARERQKTLLEDKLKRLDPFAQKLETALISARTELAQLEVSLADDHPKVLELEARVERLRSDLAARARRAQYLDLSALEAHAGRVPLPGQGNAAEGTDLLTSELIAFKALSNELEGTRSEVGLLRERIASSSHVLRSQAESERALSTLTRDLDIKLELYRNLLEKYEDALVTEQLSLYDETHQVWTVEAPVKPTRSLKPALWLVLIGASVGGFVLAFAALAVFAALDDRIRGPRDVMSSVGSAVIGRLPSQREGG